KNGWEDKDYIDNRVWGLDRARDEIDRFTPEEVARITGVPAEQTVRVARMLAENRPGTLVWCMGLTQNSMGNNKTRAATMLQLILGNTGKSGGGANIFRGHDNVQGATDMCVLNDTLPAYYGLSEGAWKHWANVWGVDYEYLRGRFSSQELMEQAGMPVSRWMDGVLDEEAVAQPNPTKAIFFWGHATNSQTRGPDRQKALDAAEMIVIVDPYPTQTAIEATRPDGMYLLPAGTTMEMFGSVTNSNRSLQWREKVVEPVFEAKSDYEIMYLFAGALGFQEEMFRYIAVEDGVPSAEDLLRELNLGSWSIGYTGQGPERLKLHMKHQDKFDGKTLRGMAAPVEGETYCLPWPCWGNAELGHPGTHILYDVSKPVAEGGLPFRARWGVEYEGENLLAENSYPVGSEIEDGYPEITMAMLDALGWAGDLTAREMLVIVAIGAGVFKREMLEADAARAGQLMTEMENTARQGTLSDGETKLLEGESWTSGTSNAQEGAAGDSLADIEERFPEYPPLAIRAIVAYLRHNPQESPPASELSMRDKVLRVSWKTDLSGGIQRVAIAHGLAPFGNGKARAFVWNFPDPIPQHREPLFTPRRDLLPEYRTWEDRFFFRLPVLFRSIQEIPYAEDFPLALTTGRLVEYEGGGDETRSNKWLAEFQQQMFAEISPADAAAAGVTDGSFVWIHTPEGKVLVAALVTPRVGPGTVFMPFHFAGVWMGEDISHRYPEGAMPYVIG
ncbi:MAG TPA: molybdopterin dinucleotide binding domain-containing protein, partial [Paracoccaceae bacterium]|nr:molybdopterin dinucleotide binding domain-containing protein [Paracoccaceae bacterium]